MLSLTVLQIHDTSREREREIGRWLRTAESENPRLGHLTTKLSSFSPSAVSLDGSNGENDLVLRAFNGMLASSP